MSQDEESGMNPNEESHKDCSLDELERRYDQIKISLHSKETSLLSYESLLHQECLDTALEDSCDALCDTYEEFEAMREKRRAAWMQQAAALKSDISSHHRTMNMLMEKIRMVRPLDGTGEVDTPSALEPPNVKADGR